MNNAMSSATHLRAPDRDPAWLSRLFWIGFALVLLWPLGVATEFRPWVLVEPKNLQVTGQFLGSFFPLAHDAEFLHMVARETWRTVAMATVGVTLALLLAIPLTLVSTRVLSISALSGRMATLPAFVRHVVRWLLIVLRSIPELVWALVFVRVVGLGPTAGVLAIALTYAGMLGKVYGEILESGEPHAASVRLSRAHLTLGRIVFPDLHRRAADDDVDVRHVRPRHGADHHSQRRRSSHRHGHLVLPDVRVGDDALDAAWRDHVGRVRSRDSRIAAGQLANGSCHPTDERVVSHGTGHDVHGSCARACVYARARAESMARRRCARPPSLRAGSGAPSRGSSRAARSRAAAVCWRTSPGFRTSALPGSATTTPTSGRSAISSSPGRAPTPAEQPDFRNFTRARPGANPGRT